MAPAGRAAEFCSALPKTQRRIFAAAWGNLSSPILFPPVAAKPVTAPVEKSQAVNSDRALANDAGARLADSEPLDAALEPSADEDIVDLAAIDAVKDVPSFPDMLGDCWGTPSGAWALLVDDVVRADDDLNGTFAIAHVDRKGRLLVAKLSTDGYTCSDCPPEESVITDNSRGDFSILDATQNRWSARGSVFDFDGDGEPEFLVTIWKWIGPNRGIFRGRIWTYRRGVVRLYGPSQHLNVTDRKDIDGDGRDDIEVFVGGGSFVSRSESRWLVTESLALFAHTLPNGKFSFTDDVAIDAAKKACKKPGSIIASQVEVLCARVWGMSADAIERAVQRGCQKAAPGTECEDLDTMRALITDPVPIVIPKSQRE
jgi:hypothetical protein